MSKRKITEFFEDKLVAEIYEKVRESDGKKFYDTIIQRRYFDNENIERRTSFFQKRDMLSIHILAVAVERYITNQLWKNRNNPGGTREADLDEVENKENDLDEMFVEE